MLGAMLRYSPWCFIALLVIIAIWRSSRKVAKQLALLPGPPALPLLGNISSFTKYNLDVIKALVATATKYDGFALVWLGRQPMVIITDPDHLKIYYTSTKMIDRAEAYNDVADVLGRDSIFAANGDIWKLKRKMFMSTFHTMPMEAVIKNIISMLPRTVSNFKKMSDSGKVFPALFSLQKAAAYSIMENALAVNKSDEEVEYALIRLNFLMDVTFTRQITPLLMSDFTFKLSTTGKMYIKYLHELRAWIKDAVIKAKGEFKKLKENGEIIPNLYAYNMIQKYPDETIESLINESMNTIITGLDTSSGTMGFILIILALFPEIQERVYQEDQQIQKMLNGRIPDSEDLQNYEYLDRVIKETLRLFPVGPIIARKLSEDTNFGKHLVPKGTDIGLLSYYTYRNPLIFPDPEKFDPDRFLPELVAKRHPYAYNPFSSGPRGCPGNRYAMTFLKITVPGLIRNFKLKSHYKDITEAFENSIAKVTLTDKQDFPVIMEPRNHIEL